MTHPSDACPGCGLRYTRFRTGLTYHEVYMMLWSYDDDPSTWRNKGRHAVLGFWREFKLQLWERHTTYECRELVPF